VPRIEGWHAHRSGPDARCPDLTGRSAKRRKPPPRDPPSSCSCAQPGVNANQLCDELAIAVPSETSVANGIPVEISAA